uniref:Uncharacterized protein n=1 Tax=Ursus maritimus TaxID=29073 RepID=A0A452TRM8_URSMA
ITAATMRCSRTSVPRCSAFPEPWVRSRSSPLPRKPCRPQPRCSKQGSIRLGLWAHGVPCAKPLKGYTLAALGHLAQTLGSEVVPRVPDVYPRRQSSPSTPIFGHWLPFSLLQSTSLRLLVPARWSSEQGGAQAPGAGCADSWVGTCPARGRVEPLQ